MLTCYNATMLMCSTYNIYHGNVICHFWKYSTNQKFITWQKDVEIVRLEILQHINPSKTLNCCLKVVFAQIKQSRYNLFLLILSCFRGAVGILFLLPVARARLVVSPSFLVFMLS